MRVVRRTFWFLVALLFLAEAWLWEHLGPLVARIVALIPFKALKDRLAVAIMRLPPWPSLVLFAVPGLILLPFKLAGLWLIARGQVIAGGGVFLLAKVVGFGITAFIFETTKPKLMQLGWFARLYALALRAKAWAKMQVEPYTRRLRAWKRYLRGSGRSQLLRRLGFLRGRAQRSNGTIRP